MQRSSLRLGVVLTNERVARAALDTAITKALDRHVEVVRCSTYDALTMALIDGDVGLAWLPPAAYVRARHSPGVRLLATVERQGASDYRGVLLGRTGAVGELSQARGARAAWVDVWSAAGYLAPRAMLRAGGVDPDRALGPQRFLGSYDAAIDALTTGAAEIAGGYCTTDADGRITRSGWSSIAPVRVLAISRPIPSDVICAGPSETSADAVSLARALASDRARDFASILGGSGFGVGDPARYDALDRMLAAIARN